MGSRKHVLDGVQGQTNPFSTIRGDKTVMWRFVKILCPLVEKGNGHAGTKICENILFTVMIFQQLSLHF